jgi:hypothetical protein
MTDYNAILKRIHKVRPDNFPCGGLLCGKTCLMNDCHGNCTERMAAFNLNSLLITLDKFAAEHPVKTYAQDFFGRFPTARRDKDGTPKTCRNYVYGDGTQVCVGLCVDCWNRPMEDKADAKP